MRKIIHILFCLVTLSSLSQTPVTTTITPATPGTTRFYNSFIFDENQNIIAADSLPVPIPEVSWLTATDLTHFQIAWEWGDPKDQFVKLAFPYTNPDFIATLAFNKVNNWPGTNLQYVRGDGIISTFPTIPTNTSQLTNGAGFLTSNQSITISGDVSGSGSTSISTTLSNTGVSAGKYDWVTVDTKGRVTSAGNMSVPTPIAFGARNFNQAYQVSSTVQSSVSLSASISCNLSLTGGQSGTVTLEISPNGTTGWIYIGEMNGSNTGTLTVGLNTTQISGAQLTADLPAGYYWRLTTTNVTGAPTYTFRGGSYITY